MGTTLDAGVARVYTDLERSCSGMVIGAPKDSDELVQQFGRVIGAIDGCDVVQVAHHLMWRRVLENYRPPALVTLCQLQEYVGVSATLWGYAIQHASKRLAVPVPVKGTLTEPSSMYRFSDVRALYSRRAEVFPAIASRKGFRQTRLPDYEAFLVLETRKVIEGLRVGDVFDLPLALPQSDAELYEQYSGRVAHVVRRRLKYGIEIEDAIDEIWVKLLNANIVVKFMRSGPSRLPAHLSLEETLGFLGVRWPEWLAMMQGYTDAPNPVRGASDTTTAVYRSEDILVLDRSGYFGRRGPRILPPHAVSREMFDKYVMHAANQHLKNLFRTLDRHFNREDTLQEGAYISENRSVHVRRDAAPGQCWEDSLRSEDPPADRVCELKERLGIAGEVYEVFTALAC